ncbi:MAG TPA: TonB-dependent receptor, partial [Bacteroidales bacterium]|nr:TonB-dependent receptor [Bacteroidales bacterium]
MKITVLFSIFLFFTGRILYSQNYHVSGTVRDSLTNETLIGAAIYIVSNSTGTVSSDSGKYSFQTNAGSCQIKISYIGYRTKIIGLIVKSDVHQDILLNPEAVTSDEIIITAENPALNTDNSRTGFVRLTAADLREVPSLMGEPDLIRALHYSPGVQSSGDGNSGFYVRGGNVDQNLILMDNAVVYNPSHVLGFFSVFNSDAVSSATLIKSGIPANYGGRISSVLAVKTIDGDFEKHHVTATAGLLYSKATIQGPIIKNKLSYFISFRKSYVNEVVKPLAGLFINPDSGGFLDGSSYGMYDLNIKLSGHMNERSRISIMYYKGRDNFHLEPNDMDFKTHVNWGNSLVAINWNYILNDSCYVLNSLNYSNYDFKYKAAQFIMNFDLYSSIRNFNYRLEYNLDTKRFGSIKSGIEAKYYNFVPNRFMLTINKTDLNYSTYQDLFAGEFSAFLSLEKDLADRVRVSAGVRAGNYRHFGPYNIINRNDELTPDTSAYKRLETIKSYTGLEPRLSIRYQTSPSSSVKASYTRNYQYIHIASASSVTMPSDIWIPSTASTAPQFGDQFTLGYYSNFADGIYTASSEMYYKKLANQVELLYGLGASLQDVSFENSLTSGKGYATGIEFFLQKQKGKLTGSIAYALSYTQRQFKKINNGNPFPAK